MYQYADELRKNKTYLYHLTDELRGDIILPALPACTVQEAQEKCRKIETEIAAMLLRYYKETGVRVSGIYVNTTEAFRRHIVAYKVEVNAEL